MKKVAVLVSGNGSNLQAIIDAVQSNALPGKEIVAVVADRNCYAIERALAHDIPVFLLDAKNKNVDLAEILQGTMPDLIVLAGYLSILPLEICTVYKNKIINLHPSLLPKYGGKGMYGTKVHQAVIDNKDTESGATIHYVTPEVDAGQIIAQQKISVDKEDTPETLAQKIHQIEHLLLIDALARL